MARVIAGDTDSFEHLLDRHSRRVHGIVARNVPATAIAEVAHNAFVAAYLALPKYVASHPFERWLTRITLRTCIDYWRAHGRSTAEPLDHAELARVSESSDDRELLDWALEQLSRDDRELLTLVYFEDLSVKECASVLDWSESNVKVRAHRARQKLRTILRRLLPERDPDSDATRSSEARP